MKGRSNLSDSFFAIYGLWQIVGILSYFIGGILVTYLAGMVAFALLALLDRRSLLDGESLRLRLKGPKAFALGDPAHLSLYFEFERSFVDKPKNIFWVLPKISEIGFVDQVISLLDLSQPKGVGFEVIADGTTRQIGYVKIDQVTIHSVSRLGFWSNSFTAKVDPIDFRVHPPEGLMNESEFAERVSKQQIFSSGIRRLLKSRSADQFYSIRKYQYPDAKRYIDGKKSAKYNQLMTRTFEEYRSHHLVLALDCSRNLMGELEGSPKMDYYISACLKLMENAIAVGDSVSLISFSDHIHFQLKQAKNRASFQNLYRGDSAFQPSDREADYHILPSAIARVASQRSIVFILTDPSMPGISKEIGRSLFPICQKHFTLVIGLSEETRKVEQYVLGLEPDYMGIEQYGRLIYNMHMEDQMELVKLRVNRWGGGIVQAEPNNWISMTKKAYQNLRSSLSS